MKGQTQKENQHPSKVVVALEVMILQKDHWDPSTFGDRMALVGNTITFHGGIRLCDRKEEGNSAFLRNIVEHGVHRWKFKVDLKFVHWWAATIGIWDCSGESAPPKNDIFTLSSLVNPSQGYGFNPSQGSLVNPVTGKVHCKSLVHYGQRCIRANIVEMVLDFNRLELRYLVNGQDYGKAFTIKKSKYRAAINLSQISDSVTLL